MVRGIDVGIPRTVDLNIECAQHCSRLLTWCQSVVIEIPMMIFYKKYVYDDL